MRLAETKALAAVLVLGVVAGAACGDDDEVTCTDTVVTRADPSGNFAKYATFAVAPLEAYPGSLPAEIQTSLTQANTAAATELTQNGFRQVDASDNPDLYLFSLSRTTDETALYWECTGDYYWYGYWGWTWDSCAWLTQMTAEYSIGTIVVGLADPALSKVVYGGAVQGILACGEDPASRIDRNVQTIMASYPYAY